MSEQHDKDFAVLDRKAVESPTVKIENEDAASDVVVEQEPVVTEQSKSDAGLQDEAVFSNDELAISEQTVVSVEEIDDEEEAAVEVAHASRSGWKWNLLNTALSFSALGACGYIFLVGQPVHNAGDNKVLSSHVSTLGNSMAAFESQLSTLSTELNSKATSEDLLILTQEVNTNKNDFKGKLDTFQLALNDKASLTNIESLVSNSIPETVTHIELEQVSKTSASAVSQVTNQVKQVTKEVADLKRTITAQSSGKYLSKFLSVEELVNQLEGNSLLSTDLLAGEPYAVFFNEESGAFIVREKDTVGQLTVTKVRTGSVEVRTAKYDVGILNTVARVK